MNILFVCSGNTCRSPMAEGYINSKNIKCLRAQSCGFSGNGDAVSQNAAVVMKEIGIDISAHISRLISKDLLSADKVFCMGENHRNALIAAGADGGKIKVLGGGIPDPFGQGIAVYRLCRDAIIRETDRALYAGEMLPVKISAAQECDAEDIALLEKQTFALPWSRNAILESMAHNTVFFKALFENSFAGYISVTAVAGEGYINNIAVKEEYRNRCIGSLLLDRAVTFGRQEGLEFISLEVRVSNKTAISLYENAEFLPEGSRKNFYEDPREDGLIMTRRF